MHRRLLIVALVGSGLLTAACGDDRSPIPVEPVQPTSPSFSHVPPTTLDMRTQIDALFRAGPQRVYAHALFSKIATLMAPNPDVTAEELKKARLTTFALVLYTVGRFHAGQLIGGKSDETKARVLHFILSLLRFVGYHDVPDLSPTVLSDDGVVAIVQPLGEQKVAPPSGDFMAVFFDNTVSQTTLVTGAQLQTAPTPGSGPLPTDGTPQFPVFVRWTATYLNGSGAATFNNSPTLIHCAVIEEAFHPHEHGESEHSHLRLARRNPDNGTVQVFPAAPEAKLIAMAAQINPATGRPYVSCENASTDIKTSSGGSGVLWLAQRGLKTAGGALVRLFAPKPLYGFTFLVGCEDGILGFSDWGIAHVNRPVEKVDLGATATTLDLGSSQTVTATLADGYALDPSKVDSKLTNPGDPVTAFEQREYTVEWSSSNSEVVSVEAGEGHTAIITAHDFGPATITASIDGVSATLVVTVVGPDLAVAAVSHSPAGANSEDPLTFNVAVQNIGERPTSVATALQLRFSGDTPVGFTSVPAGFAAGASQVFQVTHSKLAAGTYTIHAIADFTELQRETNEGNNTSADYTFTIVQAGPPTITSVVLNSTTLVIGGPSATSTVTLENPGSSVENITLQGSVVQGAATRAAGSAAAFCGSGTGILPNGTCTMTFSALAFNGLPGTGTLVPGDASYVLNLRQSVPPFTVIDSETIPITLTGPLGMQIDGVLSPGEWDDAQRYGPFTVALPGGTQTTAMLLLKNTSTQLFTALEFGTDLSAHANVISALRMDEDGDGQWDLGDGDGEDGFVAQQRVSGTRQDRFFDEFFTCQVSPCQGQGDDVWGGTNDGTTKSRDGGQPTVIEVAHGINTADVRDAVVRQGQTLKFLVLINVGASSSTLVTTFFPGPSSSAFASYTVQ